MSPLPRPPAMTPECPDWPTLRALLGGDLPEPAGAAARRHLDACAACAGRARDLAAEAARSTATQPPGPPAAARAPSTESYEPGRTEPRTPSPDAVLRWVRGLLSEPTLPDALGRVGAYEVVAVLGQGGMGVVLKAWDPRLARPVAVKLLAPQLAAHPSATARFGREARALAAVRHPNVVGIHEVGEQDGVPYLVMEFVAGPTLLDRVRANPLDAPTLAGYARQLADGLAAVHARGITHRDLKPSNVLVEAETDRVVLSDFGLALVGREASDLTAAGHVLGTPAYMAPEQVRGERADHRSDLFGLGCVLYAMAVGRSPFPGHPRPDPARPAWVRPRPLHELRPDVPRGLSDLVARLLAEDPADRPPTAAAVRDELDGAAPPPARPPAPRRGRRRWPATVAAAALVGAAAAAAAWYRPGGPPADPGGPGPGVLAAAPGGPAAPGPRTITVARAGGGDVRSFAEAVARAGPGDTVRVLDDAVYEEAVALDDPERLASVTLEGAARATVAAPPSAAAVVTVKNTPGVVVRGLRLVTQPNQHGVVVAGPTGALLDDLVVDQPEGAGWAAVAVAWGAGPALGRPVRVRNSTIRAGEHGVVIGGDGAPVTGVEVEGNRFLRGTYHVVVCRAADDVAVQGNVFCRGVAVTVDLPGTARRLRVANNTCWLTPRWLFVRNPNLPAEVEVFNNLILGADDVFVEGTDPFDLARRWSVHHNRWEPGPATDRGRAAAVADLDDRVDLLSRDPADPAFLRPPAGSPLGAQGAGGEAPPYVGALPPAAR